MYTASFLEMKDTWKDIDGYGGKYQVDTEGNVRRIYKSGKTKRMTAYKKRTSRSHKRIVKLTKDGKSKEVAVMQIVASAFLGVCPDGCVPYHKNGVQSDNYVNNIAYISRSELGKITGAKSNRKGVAKIDNTGEVVEFYSSAREAARKNYMSNQTVTDRCNCKCESAFAPDGYAYAWEDSEVSMQKAIRKIEVKNGYIARAQNIEFDF